MGEFLKGLKSDSTMEDFLKKLFFFFNLSGTYPECSLQLLALFIDLNILYGIFFFNCYHQWSYHVLSLHGTKQQARMAPLELGLFIFSLFRDRVPY